MEVPLIGMDRVVKDKAVHHREQRYFGSKDLDMGKPFVPTTYYISVKVMKIRTSNH